MGSMAALHEGRLQVFICSREGQIETKKQKSLVPRFCANASASFTLREVHFLEDLDLESREFEALENSDIVAQ